MQLLKFKTTPKQCKTRALTFSGHLQEQREAVQSLGWGVNGLDVEIWLSVAGGGLFVAPGPVDKKQRLPDTNEGNHCVPDVLITLVNGGEGWIWTATTKSGRV